METRFTRIIDELSQLGKNYTQNEKNRRVLKSLPPSWKVKVTTIKEMHNLNEYKIDNLFRNLRAYEEDNIPEKVAPKVEDKNKNMVLKAILIDEEKNDEELNEELQNLNESEIALRTRQLRRVLQSKAQRYGRSLVAENGWDLSEDEEAPEASEEVVNLCLMALREENTSREVSSTNEDVTSNYVSLKSLLDESNLSLMDMNKHDLIGLVVEYKNKYKYVDQRLHLVWLEKMKIEEIHHTQNKEYTRMMDSRVQDEKEITSLKDQNHLIKVEVNKLQENIINHEIENISLILKEEEMVCLDTKQDIWYLDSGCSRHMTGNKSLLNNIKKVIAWSVTFGDNSKGNIVGIGDIRNGKTLEMLEKKESVLTKKVYVEVEKAREYTRAKNKKGTVLT
ncbi:hypothetical protein AgCh_009883 [Apium graveolens]